MSQAIISAGYQDAKEAQVPLSTPGAKGLGKGQITLLGKSHQFIPIH